MACILKPECNFLHGYFRCLLPLETVNNEGKGENNERSTHLEEIEPPRSYHATPGAQGSIPIHP